MNKFFVACGLAAILAVSGCSGKSKQESTVELNGVKYRVIGAERVDARANNQVRRSRDAQGVDSETKVISQTIVLNGTHTVGIDEDGSFTVNGEKVNATGAKSPVTIRLDGDKVTIE